MSSVDVVVIGAGVIGLGIAWRCAERGLTVTVVDPAPGSGASRVAAGMLAPVTELHYGERSLFALNLASAARYPQFVRDVEDLTGLPVGYRPTGTVMVAWDRADLAALEHLAAYSLGLGGRTESLSGRELRRLVPFLAPGLPGGILAADDHQVDNRLLHEALIAAVGRTGGRLERQRVAGLMGDTNRVTGVRLADRSSLHAATTVLAAGAWSSLMSGIPAGVIPPVRPVKGQTLRLQLPPGTVLPYVVRGSVRGSPIYAAPRENGELVVGASTEEAGFDDRPRAGAVYELLRDAQSLLPVVAEAELREVSTGLRPGTPDNAPLIGPAGVEGLFVATGHYRNGILLAAITSDAVAGFLAGEEMPAELTDFSPQRFHPLEVLA